MVGKNNRKGEALKRVSKEKLTGEERGKKKKREIRREKKSQNSRYAVSLRDRGPSG